jgi:hypothetical protein
MALDSPERAERPLAGDTMSALRSFLKERAQEQQETKAERMAAIAEWKAAIESLIGQFERWLQEADQPKALSIERIPVTIREKRLGIYDVEGLRVRFKDRYVRVEPAARYPDRPPLGDDVEMTARDGRAILEGGKGEYTFYRRKKEDGDEWVIAEGRNHHPQILDQSTFEDAVYKLLK